MYLFQLIFIFLSVIVYTAKCKTVTDKNNANGLDSYIGEEFRKLHEFRSRIKGSLTQPYMSENKYLIRFLRAKELDIDQAVTFLLESLAWRKDHKADSLLKRDFSKWQSRYPFYFNLDFEGRPGIVSSLLDFDIRRAVLAGQSEEFNSYLVYAFETCVAAIHHLSNSTGKEIISGNVVYNMAGFNLRSHACLACLPIWIENVVVYERRFPQMAHRFIFLNVPRVFQSVYQVLKPFLSPHTSSILRIYGVDKSEWSPALLKIFPGNQLPASLGGTAPKRDWREVWLT